MKPKGSGAPAIALGHEHGEGSRVPGRQQDEHRDEYGQVERLEQREHRTYAFKVGEHSRWRRSRTFHPPLFEWQAFRVLVLRQYLVRKGRRGTRPFRPPLFQSQLLHELTLRQRSVRHQALHLEAIALPPPLHAVGAIETQCRCFGETCHRLGLTKDLNSGTWHHETRWRLPTKQSAERSTALIGWCRCARVGRICTTQEWSRAVERFYRFLNVLEQSFHLAAQ